MKRVLILGATGTIGRATTHAFLAAGHDVTCVVRAAAEGLGKARLITSEVTKPGALSAAFADEKYDVMVSCLASRNGAPDDAWAVDCAANLYAFEAAKSAGVGHVILLSAICVQKPMLAFQHAKLKAEKALIDSGLRYSIVRSTAYFKSLSGQIARVKAGKPYLLFGNGTLTACKPISDADLARYMVGCVTDPARHNQVLPIGGPGPAITPLEQGAHLFDLAGTPARYRHVPVWLLNGIIGALGMAGRIVPRLKNAAEFARIAKYYATESMLVWDAEAEAYDADATPSTGQDTLFEHYAGVMRSGEEVDLGAHKVF